MLALQRLLRSRPKWSCGTAHIFWYIMDEHAQFWVKWRWGAKKQDSRLDARIGEFEQL